MAYVLVGEYLWSKNPNQYAHIYYDHRRVGADMQYKYKVVIDGVSAPYVMGYPIKLTASVMIGATGVSDNDISLKEATPNRYDDIVYERPDWATIKNKTSGTGTLRIRLYTGYHTSDEDEETHIFNIAVDPAASVAATTNGKIGTEQTIGITRYDSGFTHTIVASCGGYSQTIVTKGTSTSVKWTPSGTLARGNKTSNALSVTLTTTTYSGSTVIGTTTTAITIFCYTKPTISVSLTPINPDGTITALANKYIQNKSTVKVSITPTLSYDSPIASYSVKVGSFYTSTSQEATSVVIPMSGKVAITASAVDKRGNASDVYSAEIDVIPYLSPQFASVTAVRCNADGDVDPHGERAKVTLTASATVITINGQNANSATFSVQKRATDGIWESLQQIGVGSGVTNASYILTDVAATKAYEIRCAITDGFGTVYSDVIVISFAEEIMDVYPSGKGVAFGKLATEEGKLDSEWKAIFRDGIDLRGPLSFGGTYTAAQARQSLGITDPEAGTYYPVISNGTRNVGCNYEQQRGQWLRIGKLCFFSIRLKGTITESGEYAYINLPFAPDRSQVQNFCFSLGSAVNATTPEALCALTHGDENKSYFCLENGKGTLVKWAVTGSPFWVQVSGIYLVN